MPMNHREPGALPRAEHRESRVRSEYLIERFRVVFESGSQWFCGCAEFRASSVCCHTREAAGRRSAQAHIADHVATGRSNLVARSPRSLRAQVAPVSPRTERASGASRAEASPRADSRLVPPKIGRTGDAS